MSGAARAHVLGRLSAALGGLALALVATSAAANPFGVGVTAPAGPSIDGPFGGLLAWIAVQQAAFYRALTDTLAAAANDPSAGWWLVLLGFAYGMFHAAGPGHGKAVISAYVLADRQSVARAIGLSFGAALVQATSAIILVLVAVSVLGLTSIALGATARWIEVASYAALTLIGAVLVWRKVIAPLVRAGHGAMAPAPRSVSAAAVGVETGHHAHGHAHHHEVAHGRGHEHGCCDHAHAVTPEMARRTTDWRSAIAVMVSVGLRPCSGAIIVLVFALATGLLPFGILSVFAMGLGVGLTVAAIAGVSVLARSATEHAAGGMPIMASAFRLLEGTAALALFAFGALLLSAALLA